MAIVVLVLWLFTAGAGFYLLFTSSLAARAEPPAPQPTPTAQPTPVTQSAAVPQPAAASSAANASATAANASATAANASATAATAPRTADGPPSRRTARRAARQRWDPPSLVAARQAPVLPGARSLVEFAHPTGGIIGLAFWLGFTLAFVPKFSRSFKSNKDFRDHNRGRCNVHRHQIFIPGSKPAKCRRLIAYGKP